MNETTTTLYRVQEFAELAGVTVRALHHYDRVGLLKPTSRTGSSYRLYSEADLARLEQIVVLKFLGMPLREIRDLLSDESSLEVALCRQQKVLVEKRRNLEHAIMAIRNAEKSLQSKGRPDWKLFKRVIQEIEMQNTTDWSKRYYSDDAKAKIEERAKLWSPELQDQVTKDWDQLFADVKASLGEDPASAKAQELGREMEDTGVRLYRWRPGSREGSQRDVRRSRELARRTEGASSDAAGDLDIHSEGLRSRSVALRKQKKVRRSNSGGLFILVNQSRVPPVVTAEAETRMR
jgi:DNA-binding transcriptional MerR regulator